MSGISFSVEHQEAQRVAPLLIGSAFRAGEKIIDLSHLEERRREGANAAIPRWSPAMNCDGFHVFYVPWREALAMACEGAA